MTSGAELYLTVEVRDGQADRLKPLLSDVRPACVLLVPAPGSTLDARAVVPFIEIIQRADAAALLADDARLARTVKADGVHLFSRSDALDHYREARDIVGSGRIVGVDAGTLRHDAMSLAEAGADYVAFGAASGDARALRDDLIAWWAEIFEPPCVAFDVANAEEAAEVASLGADFVAVRLAGAQTLADAQAMLRAIAGAASMGEVVP